MTIVTLKKFLLFEIKSVGCCWWAYWHRNMDRKNCKFYCDIIIDWIGSNWEENWTRVLECYLVVQILWIKIWLYYVLFGFYWKLLKHVVPTNWLLETVRKVDIKIGTSPFLKYLIFIKKINWLLWRWTFRIVFNFYI